MMIMLLSLIARNAFAQTPTPTPSETASVVCEFRDSGNAKVFRYSANEVNVDSQPAMKDRKIQDEIGAPFVVANDAAIPVAVQGWAPRVGFTFNQEHIQYHLVFDKKWKNPEQKTFGAALCAQAHPADKMMAISYCGIIDAGGICTRK